MIRKPVSVVVLVFVFMGVLGLTIAVHEVKGHENEWLEDLQ